MGRKNGWDDGTGDGGDGFVERRDGNSRHRALQSWHTGRPFASTIPDPETRREWDWSWWEHCSGKTTCPLPLPPPPLRVRVRRMSPWQLDHGLLSIAVMLLLLLLFFF
jgi:hypothetical protein